jgi:hypothetical protein
MNMCRRFNYGVHAVVEKTGVREIRKLEMAAT